MKTKSISKVIRWAATNRPPGYIDILKKMSETWDVKKDEYTITDDNWNALAKDYGQVESDNQNLEKLDPAIEKRLEEIAEICEGCDEGYCVWRDKRTGCARRRILRDKNPQMIATACKQNRWN